MWPLLEGQLSTSQFLLQTFFQRPQPQSALHMSNQASKQELAASILDFVETSAYPQSDNVASTELSAAALPVILDVVGGAEEDLKV
jgi:hypothetical protein